MALQQSLLTEGRTTEELMWQSSEQVLRVITRGRKDSGDEEEAGRRCF